MKITLPKPKGRKPLPDTAKKERCVYWLLRHEKRQVEAFIARMRAEAK